MSVYGVLRTFIPLPLSQSCCFVSLTFSAFNVFHFGLPVLISLCILPSNCLGPSVFAIVIVDSF